MLIYEVFGTPIPWKAPLINKKTGAVYSPQNVDKKQVVWQLKSQCNHEPLTCPIWLSVTFYRPIPASASGIKRRQMLNGAILPIGKPDRSNMLKWIEDRMQDAGILSNDSIIVDGPTSKRYGLEPKTVILVRTIEEWRQSLAQEGV